MPETTPQTTATSTAKTSASSDDNHQSIAQYGVGVVVYAIFLGCVVALIAGSYEFSFRWLARLWHEDSRLFDYFPQWLVYAIGTFIACPILYFIIARIPEKRQHNPADLITGIHINNGRIDAEASLLTALASVFSIGFGFSVGYYAPTVQLGAGAGYLCHRIKWLAPAHYYISIGAGTAAAIAAIFHSPIGAVMFVHEVLLRFFSIRAFAPITIAAVTSYIVSSQLFDKMIFFDIPAHYAPTPPVYLVAAGAGVLAAFIGISMIRIIMRVQQFNRQRQWGSMRQLLIAAALTGGIIAVIPEVAGSSLDAMNQVLGGGTFALSLLLLIFIAKGAATMIAFGFGVPGGIFGPTIFIGAALGGLVSGVIQMLFPDLVASHEIIIITTMAAMISAVLGAPITMILITVEITGDFHIISVVMLAVVMANITAYRFMGTSSFFDIQLKSRGFDFEQGRDQIYMENRSISELISKDYLAIHESTSPEEAEKQMLAAHKNIAFVVDDDHYLRGQVRLVDIEFYRRETPDDSDNPVTLSAVTYTNISTVYRATSIWQAMQEMTHANVNLIPVVDGENNPTLLGVVYNNTVIAQYLSFIHQLRTQENAVR